jgi:hypothetical protein
MALYTGNVFVIEENTIGSDSIYDLPASAIKVTKVVGANNLYSNALVLSDTVSPGEDVFTISTAIKVTKVVGANNLYSNALVLSDTTSPGEDVFTSINTRKVPYIIGLGNQFTSALILQDDRKQSFYWG